MTTRLLSCGRNIGFAVAILALSGGAALAQATREQQEACAPDAVRLCAATIPDIAKTTACMKSHVGDLSPRCRTMFNTAAASSGIKATAAKPAAVSPKPETRRAAAPPKPSRRDVAGDTRRDGARKVVTRAATVRTVTLPPRRRPEVVMRPEVTPVPVAAQPVTPVFRSRVPGLDNVATSIAQSCREGLIDAFTCRTTFDALQITE